MHTSEGTKKFSAQRLKREHEQIIVFISKKGGGGESVFEAYCLIPSLNSHFLQTKHKTRTIY